MNALLPILLNWFQLYGYPVLWVSVFLAAAGVPLPINLVLLAAGAFAALGDSNLFLLILTATSAAIAGDSVGYLIGRRIGSGILTWLAQQSRWRLISPQMVERSQLYFQRRGGIAIFLTRFLVTALGGAINIIAGAELYPYKRFLLYDSAGELLGSALPLGLGFLFGASWEALGDIMVAISTGVAAVLVALYLLVQLVRMVQRRKKRVDKRQVISKEQKSRSIPQVVTKTSDILPPSEGFKRIK